MEARKCYFSNTMKRETLFFFPCFVCLYCVGRKISGCYSLGFRTHGIDKFLPFSIFLSPPKCEIEKKRWSVHLIAAVYKIWIWVFYGSVVFLPENNICFYLIIEANKVTAIKRSYNRTKKPYILFLPWAIKWRSPCIKLQLEVGLIVYSAKTITAYVYMHIILQYLWEQCDF